MTDETTEAVTAADEEVIVADDASEAAETIEAPEADTPEEAEKKTRSQERREQRRAETQRLRESEAEANRKLAAETARLDRLKQAAARLPEPKEADFPNYEAYLAASTAFASIKALDGRTEADIQAEIEERRKEVAAVKERQHREDQANWKSQVDEAKGRYSDFDAVVYADDVPITERLAGAIMSTDAPADIAYRIASDKTLAQSMSAMSDLELGREIGRIEAMLAAPKPKTSTSAPAPISPVKGSGGVQKDPEKMTPQEWRAYREAGGKA